MNKTWQEHTLGSLCEPFKRINSERQDLPPLSVTKSEGIVFQSERFTKRIATDISKYKVLFNGDFCYDPMSLYYGAIGRLTGAPAGIVSPAYISFRLKADVDHDFFWYLVKSAELQAKFIKATKGGNRHGKRKKTDWQDFAAINVALPPIMEQRRIAAILTAVDTGIARTRAVVDQINQVKKGLMQSLLSKGIPHRHTRFTQTELGKIPVDWTFTSVGACCSIRDDLRKPLNKDERAKMQGPYPYYGPTKALDSISEYRLEGTYALIGEDGDHFLKFDRWSMTQLVSGKFNVNNHAHVIAGSESCSAAWFALFFRHRDLRPVLTRQGANRYKLRKSTLDSLPIALPPLSEQKSICAIVHSMDNAELQGLADLDGLKVVRDALASRLLTGKLRVRPEPAPEPAP